MTSLFQPVEMLAREAGDAARAALWRVALIIAALLIASLGAVFLIFAVYLGLRFLFGPGLAALSMGTGLLAMAAGVFLIARGRVPKAGPKPVADPGQIRASARHPESADAATIAVYTAAFLIGRRLADRWGQSLNP